MERAASAAMHPATMQRLMQVACAEAQASWRDGGAPVGAVLAQRWEEAWKRPPG